MLEVLVYAAIGMYGIGPLIVWLTLSQRVPAEIAKPGVEYSAAIRALRESAAPLFAIGFQELGAYLYCTIRQPAPVLLLRDQDGTTMCLIATLGSKRLTEFGSRAEDGRCFFTNDFPMVLPNLEHPPNKKLRQFPGKPIDELYQAHLRLRAHELGLRLRHIENAGQLIEEMLQYERAEADFHVGRGWAKLRNGNKRLTLVGAYLMSWRNAWPVTAMRRWRARRENNAALAAAISR